MITPLDYAVILLYLVGVAVFGIRAGGRQSSTAEYFLGNRELPWWAVCFSVVATETSTLTVIGVPAISFLGTLTFLQLTFGYLLGRVLVAVWFLPRYFEGNLSTAYAFLGQRFGDGMRATASITFIITRLLADGVRLFATAIPIKVIADSAGVQTAYWQIILVIGLVTIVYTFIGGIKAVVWMDVVQMFIYLAGAVGALLVLLAEAPAGWWGRAVAEGKTTMLYSGFDAPSFSAWLTEPYALVAAVVGGAALSMASHGTDQLIVQRLLTCRTLADSRRALVVSGVVVVFQFALFLAVGLLLWAYYGGRSLVEIGVARGDEIFPKFIIEGLPPGVSGLILAGILAAAMSTVSSSLNSLASSTMLDLYERFVGRMPDERKALRLSRFFTLFWGLVFIGFANLFQEQTNPVVELGLSIASFTYGGLLGVFLLGLLNRRVGQGGAVVAFFFALAFMTWLIFGLWFSAAEDAWVVRFRPPAELVAALELKSIAWPWYTVIGSSVALLVGSLAGLLRRR